MKGPGFEPNGDGPQSWEMLANSHPCNGCVAPCCRILMLPHKRPETWLDFDYIRYVLGFRHLEVFIDTDGDWHIAVIESCQHLDEETSTCTVFGTNRRPRVCSNYPPDDCWYQRGFTGIMPRKVVRLDLAAFEEMLPLLVFDGDGRLVRAPGWDALCALSVDRPIDQPVGSMPSRSHAVRVELRTPGAQLAGNGQPAAEATPQP